MAGKLEGVGLAVMVGASVILSALVYSHETGSIQYGYVLLWQEAVRRCQPTYPQSSIQSHHQGLAVAEVEVAADGELRHFAVLQAPDPAMAQSVNACATVFRAGVQRDGRRLVRRGKLFFYFVISDGRGEVFTINDPQQKASLVSRGFSRETDQ